MTHLLPRRHCPQGRRSQRALPLERCLRQLLWPAGRLPLEGSCAPDRPGSAPNAAAEQVPPSLAAACKQSHEAVRQWCYNTMLSHIACLWISARDTQSLHKAKALQTASKSGHAQERPVLCDALRVMALECTPCMSGSGAVGGGHDGGEGCKEVTPVDDDLPGVQ